MLKVFIYRSSGGELTELHRIAIEYEEESDGEVTTLMIISYIAMELNEQWNAERQVFK